MLGTVTPVPAPTSCGPETLTNNKWPSGPGQWASQFKCGLHQDHTVNTAGYTIGRHADISLAVLIALAVVVVLVVAAIRSGGKPVTSQ